jgi:Helix-turn-helix
MVPPSSSSLQGYLVAVTDKGFYLALGQRVAAARKARDLTQQQLADELGIAQQTLATTRRDDSASVSRCCRPWPGRLASPLIT